MADARRPSKLSPAVAPSLLREMNQRLLLDLLFAGGPATRPQLAKATGLSQPTVISALSDLERQQLVLPRGLATSAPGRTPMLYEFNPAAGAVIGVDVGRQWLRLLVTDLAGSRLSQINVRNRASDRDSLVGAITGLVARGSAEAGLSPELTTHTVIGSPGVIKDDRSKLLYAVNLPDWHRSDVQAALQERIGPDVSFENDANLAALGEYTYGAGQAADPFAYLTIGTGVGVGLVIDGHLYRGFTGSAGEVAYLPIGQEIVLRKQRPAPGMLEQSVSADAIVERARAAGMTGPLTAEKVFRAARRGDRAAAEVVAHEAQLLARVVASISALLDPELIVVGGGVGQNLDLLQPLMMEELARLTLMRPALAVGDLRRDAVVMGAIAMGIEQAREAIFATRHARAAVPAQPGAGRSDQVSRSPAPR
jgi:predicted NBD/HSP70 family sugar kinase